MSLPIPSATDPTMGEAMAALAAAESSDSPQGTPATPPPDSAIQPPTAPVVPQTNEGTPPEPKPGETGAPATTETTEIDKTKSKYAQSEERKARSWKEINTEKEATRAESAKIKSDREALQREQLAFDKKRSEATKSSQKPPEFYEQGAATLERNAEIAEKRGDFDLADELRVKAKMSKQLAAELRANPPKPDPTEEQTKAAFDTEQKKWVSKAGIDYPELTKKGPKGEPSSTMLKLNALVTPGSDGYDQIVHEAVKTSPAGMYYAARLAHSETVAARVPTLEKDLADSRAEVKRLNEKLSVGSGGLVNGNPQAKAFEQMSEAEQEEQLRSEAMQIRR